tara:strand:+ start:227 stop:838 length:612 start_codon:yes stop_codon:yes gene_type:complete
LFKKSKPIVLVHGLWDNPSLFDNFKSRLQEEGFSVLAPHLPHKYGYISIPILARKLDRYILNQLGQDVAIDLVGFSMGGLIARVWLQNMQGAERTNRFFSIGSPHKGTFAAQMVPSWMLAGVAEMKRGSSFLRNLNDDISSLRKVQCISYFCKLDLMVFPGWDAVLPFGISCSVPVLTHKGLILNSSAIEILVEDLLRGDIKT